MHVKFETEMTEYVMDFNEDETKCHFNHPQELWFKIFSGIIKITDF